MDQWLKLRGEYLDVLLASAGRTSPPRCSVCLNGREEIKCSDCFGANTFCKDCCLKVHKTSPFHRLSQWTGKHYTPTSLYSLGFVLRLGHKGELCPRTVEVCLYVIHSITCADMYARVSGQQSDLPPRGVGPHVQGHRH